MLLAAFSGPLSADFVKNEKICADPAQSVFHESLDGWERLPGCESLRLQGPRLSGPSVRILSGRQSNCGSISSEAISGKRTAIAVISSALLPGLGELVLYANSRDRWTLARVPVFMAFDAYFWYGYRSNYDEGKKFKREYESYADEHWDLGRFLDQHPCCDGLGGCDSWQEYNEACRGSFNYFVFTPKEIDREEYYENIGKYDAFVYGWDDWTNPYEYPDFWTPHRKRYWWLRGESDKYLLRSDEFVMALIINRVVSVVDTGWLAYRMSRGAHSSDGWSFRLKMRDEAPCLIMSRRF